jgi:hypothetical protein
MKGMFLAIISIILLTSTMQKIDIAVPQYDTNVIYGKSEITVLGWDRSYSEKNVARYI